MTTRFKRAILPLWNGGHRLAWSIGEYAEAVARGRLGRCACCGAFGPMLRRRRSIPVSLRERWGLSPRVVEALINKETLICWRCGAKLRNRRLAEVVLSTFPAAGGPRSLRDWSVRPEARALRVAEINRIDGLHEALGSLPFFAPSQYREVDDRAGGAVPHEDLMRLTYPDASFELVLTSETLEHVPDLGVALSEIRRVLVPGGWHLFTVPMIPGVRSTFARMTLGPGGVPIHHAPPIFHPGGGPGLSGVHGIRRGFPADPRPVRVRHHDSLRPHDRGRHRPGHRVPEALRSRPRSATIDPPPAPTTTNDRETPP